MIKHDDIEPCSVGKYQQEQIGLNKQSRIITNEQDFPLAQGFSQRPGLTTRITFIFRRTGKRSSLRKYLFRLKEYDEEVFGAGTSYLSIYLTNTKVVSKLDKELPSGTYQLLESHSQPYHPYHLYRLPPQRHISFTTTLPLPYHSPTPIPLIPPV
ncbi:hypothetical protein OSB04_018265 [Centaurea solstitialis]|uniref:Uncharacterized protein n=1 Tax=Centaurea solstitialis TaxID=347529 RepID=A0AA38T4G7_9ASTR|nr:hypothetical protein OSB04_018265 [Centaurea solstitialis]